MIDQGVTERLTSPDVQVNLANEFRSLIGEVLQRREVTTRSSIATMRRNEIARSTEFNISPNNEPEQSYKVLDREPLRVQVRVSPWSRSLKYVTGVDSDLLRPYKDTKLLKWEIPHDRVQIESLLRFIKTTFEPGAGKEFTER